MGIVGLGPFAQFATPPPPVLDNVVTLTAALWPEVPTESPASTVKLYVVEAARPVTANDVLEVVPIELPFSDTV
jgi:hypothetical protein